jgi:hypothetical protein
MVIFFKRGLLPWFFLCASLSAPALARDYSIEEAPAWVQHIQPDITASRPVGEVSDGEYFVLADEQLQVDGANRIRYNHYATRAINDKGLGAIASIEIGFDPAYETLTLHAINVIRDGKVISKLATAKVRILQRETELDYRIFDGRKTANVFLDDVRVGDVVEYAYSLRGANPVFGGHHFGEFDMSWRVPVAHRFARLLVPQGSEPVFTYHNKAPHPQLLMQGDYREYRWDLRNIAPLHVDNGAPAWYDPYPWVEWGDFKDWGEVVRWAEPYYRTPAKPGAALRAEVARIVADYSQPKERVQAALQFVQREIRYLGVEIGASSHAPTAPDLVLQRRFGDCKDKALLTVTLLRALGFNAHPMLVNTSLKQGVRDYQASPAAFNHVIVQLKLGTQTYWLDPTRAPQPGGLDTIYQPDFGYGLVVDDATNGLVSMAADVPARVFRRLIIAKFDTRSGFEQPVGFTLTTVTVGAAAESLRNNLATQDYAQLQKQYLNYYAHYFPGISVKAPIEVNDDTENNQFTVVEHYQIKNFWRHNAEKKRLEATVFVPDLEDYLRRPDTTIRTAPLALQHPLDIAVRSVWQLPEAWPISKNDYHVSNAAFDFNTSLSLENNAHNVVELDRFTTHKNYVSAADTPSYAADLDKARAELGTTLFKFDEKKAPTPEYGPLAKFNWTIAVIAALMLAAFIWLASRVYRYDPLSRQSHGDPSLQGISGWLMLPAISLVLRPLILLKNIYSTLPTYATDNWMNVTVAGQPGYHPLWAPTLLFELAANLGLVVASVLLLILFVRKRSSVPNLFIAVMVSHTAILLIDHGMVVLVSQSHSADVKTTLAPVLGQISSLVVWGWYFQVSRRVKATFVVTLHRAEERPLRQDEF